MKAIDLKLGQRVRFREELHKTTEPETRYGVRMLIRRWKACSIGPVAQEGIVVGIRWLPWGRITLGLDVSFFIEDHDSPRLLVDGTTPAALIAYDVRRKPIFVAVSDLEVLE